MVGTEKHVSDMTSRGLPKRARIVVIGGGVVGASVAYHLAALGETDVILVEKASLTAGSTWHAAGLVGAIRATETLTRIASRSRRLYRAMEATAGMECGYVECGGLWVARTAKRLESFRDSTRIADLAGVQAHMVDARQASDMWPLLDPNRIVGAMWAPDEGRVSPADLTGRLAGRARKLGVTIHEGVNVTGLKQTGGRIEGVHTSVGDVECEIVVNAAGQWAPNIARMAGRSIPIHPVSNTYVVTSHSDTIPALANMRDPDAGTYYKSETSALVFGGLSAATARPWLDPSQIPQEFAFKLLPENWEEFLPLLEAGAEMTPVLRDIGLQRLYNGPEAFTPDHTPVVGWTSESRSLFTVAGMNGSGVGLAGGMGEVAAAMVLGRDPDVDMTELAPSRFWTDVGDESWVRAAVAKSVLHHFSVSSLQAASHLH